MEVPYGDTADGRQRTADGGCWLAEVDPARQSSALRRLPSAVCRLPSAVLPPVDSNHHYRIQRPAS